MKEANAIVQAILDAKNIVITSHRSPDGDSIGSSLGLYHFIKALGKDATICHPDPCPDFIVWAKDGVEILDFENNQEEIEVQLKNADLLFSLDYNAAHRLGRDMEPAFTAAEGKKIMIDHHLDPDDYASITVSEPEICSTAQLIYELIADSDNLNLLNKAIGMPLYLGIMTDTGSFRFSSVSPRTHNIIASLIENGTDHTAVHEATFGNNRIDKMKLRGYIIAERLEFMEDLGVAIVSVTEKELERFNFIKGDTEGVVNVALSMEGVRMAVFMRESDDMIKMSFRSTGDTVVNELANEHFNGGGHKNASGGASFLSLDETIAKFKEVAPKYFG